jgi:hypothetical protein
MLLSPEELAADDELTMSVSKLGLAVVVHGRSVGVCQLWGWPRVIRANEMAQPEVPRFTDDHEKDADCRPTR